MNNTRVKKITFRVFVSIFAALILVVIFSIFGFLFCLAFGAVSAILWFFFKGHDAKTKSIVCLSHVFVFLLIFLAMKFWLSESPKTERENKESSVLSLSNHTDNTRKELEDIIGKKVAEVIIKNASDYLDAVKKPEDISGMVENVSKEVSAIFVDLKKLEKTISSESSLEKKKVMDLPINEKSPLYIRLTILALLALIPGVIASLIKWLSPGLASSKSKLIWIGYAIGVLAAVVWLFAMPDISKEPRGVIFGKEIGFFDLPNSVLPLKTMALGVFVLFLGITSIFFGKKNSTLFGLGLVTVVIAMILFLSPLAEKRIKETWHNPPNLSDIRIPEIKFGNSEKKVNGLSSVSNFNEWITVVDVALSPNSWTEWFDSRVYKKWRFFNDQEIKIEIKNEGVISADSDENVNLGPNKVVRFSGNGNLLIKALPW